MRISNIPNITAYSSFKGYANKYNNIGENVYHFNYPFDYENNDMFIEFYPTQKKSDSYGGYKVIEKPAFKVKLNPNGSIINKKELPFENNAFAYRFKDSNGNYYTDSGFKIIQGGSEFNIIVQNSTTPIVNGAGCLTMPDHHRVGAYYKPFDDINCGEIVYDKALQAQSEKIIKNSSNKIGGSLAGIEYDIPLLKSLGFKTLFSTPIVGGDDINHGGYWTKNNIQIAENIGNTENIKTFAEKLYQNGMKFVFDGIFTSESLEGIHFQYAQRWADENPQTLYWFKMDSIKESPVEFGVLPKNTENLRHRVINPNVIYNEKTKKVEVNPNYNPNKETLFQIYDKKQVNAEQLQNTEQIIRRYENNTNFSELSTTNHNDTVTPYVFSVNPSEYKKSLENFAEFNQSSSSPISIDSADATIQIAQFTNFKLNKKQEGGYIAWDSNWDLAKLNYYPTGYDNKNIQALSIKERESQKQLREVASYEVRDLAIQTGKYWTQTFKEIQELYTANVLKNVHNFSDIQDLVNKGLLPQEAVIPEETFNNVINGFYNFEPKGHLKKDEITIKALMKLPLDSLEFAENTVGVLSTSYFSNRATSEDNLGLSRYELYKLGNPHLKDKYSNIYTKVEELYLNELKNFSDKVLVKIDKFSKEKIFDKSGNYTEYGEYVINLLAKDIVKYALLKSLTGNKLPTKTLENGEITYNYNKIKETTSLKSLGINGVTPEDEALKLEKLIQKGLSKLTNDDVNYISKSLIKKIDGTNLTSFRLSEAIVKQSGLGLDWRLDAAKDIFDMDSVRSGEVAFDEAWDNIIDFWKHFVNGIKSENPNSNIIAEITDINKLMQSTYGKNSNVYDTEYKFSNKYKNINDAMTKFFNKTGITTEAGYSYFFTDLLKMFSADIENGNGEIDIKTKNNILRSKIKELIDTKNIDYIRNLYTFADNHDKPSIIHGMMLDMDLYYSKFDNEAHKKLALYALNPEVTDKNNIPQHTLSKIYESKYFDNINPRTIALSVLIKDIVNSELYDIATEEEIKYLNIAITDLANGKYYLEKDLPAGSNELELRKNAYASRDIETVIKMIIKQAEYRMKTDKLLQDNEHIMNSDKILNKLYCSSTEPAVQKAIMYMEYLSALPGIPTIYLRDMLCGLGMEEKAKNVYLQNRNSILWSELEDSPLKGYRNKVLQLFKEAFESREKVLSLSNGTPYLLGTDTDSCPAYLMQSANGDMSISIFNGDGINYRNRVNYFDEYELDTPEKQERFFKENEINSINPANPYVPIQKSKEINPIILGTAISLPLGTIFININPNDKSEYIVKKNQFGQTVIAKKGFDKILLNGLTSKNGVMILKKIKKH